MPKTKVIRATENQTTETWESPALQYPQSDDEHDQRPHATVIQQQETIKLDIWDTPHLRIKSEDDLESQAVATVFHKTDNWPAKLWETPHLEFAADESASRPTLIENLEPEEELKMPTAEEIEAIQKQAYDEAFKKGYEEGQQRGEQDGKAVGVKQGYEDGLTQGREQGLQEGISLVKEKAISFDAILSRLHHPLEQLDTKVEQQITSLAITLAKHLIRRELKTDPGQIIPAVKQAVSVLPVSERKIRVHLHPADAALVKETLAVTEDNQESAHWQLVEDPALTRGGCMVEAGDSRVDATVENRMASIITQFLGGEREGDLD